MNAIIDFSSLFPNFSTLQSLTTESISAWFFILIFSVFGFFLIYVLLNFFKANSVIDHLEKTIKKEEGNITKNPEDIIFNTDPLKTLWREFRHTLIQISENGNTISQNSIDSAHFFNESTLAPGITENRLLAAVPGFLTAIGVIGTFMGLQQGLGGINLSADAGIEELRSGIGNMINGASVAFMTSLWGVFLSVIFNSIEKILERIIRKKISRIQTKLEQVFHRISAEEQLVKIHKDGIETRKILNELVEQIGGKLQEDGTKTPNLAEQIGSQLQVALSESTNAMANQVTEALNQIVGPAITNLVDHTNKGNEDTLNSLMERFSGALIQQSETQRKAMETTSKHMSDTFSQVKQGLDEFIENMQIQQQKELEKSSKYHENFENQLKQSIQQNAKVIQEIENQSEINTEKMQESLANFLHRTNESSEDSTKRMQTIFTELMEDLREKDSNIKDHIQLLLEKLKELVKEIEISSQKNIDASSNMETASQNLSMASNKIENGSNHLRNASEMLSQSILKATDQSLIMQEEAKSLIHNVSELQKDLKKVTHSFHQTVEAMDRLFDKSNNIFGNLNLEQEKFLDGLKSNMQDLIDIVANLMNDYKKEVEVQTNDRMDAWNQHTENYTAIMTNAVKTIATIVDEIESKSQKQRN